jgi:hypothetical protein
MSVAFKPNGGTLQIVEADGSTSQKLGKPNYMRMSTGHVEVQQSII